MNKEFAGQTHRDARNDGPSIDMTIVTFMSDMPHDGDVQNDL